MNCEQIKQKLNIRTVLESFGRFPAKENKRTAFYFALDREEKTPSLSVDFVKSRAFDFGTGKSYDIISIVQLLNRCSVSQALEYLKKLDFSYVEIPKQPIEVQETIYKITKVTEIVNPALINYLNTRKVLQQKKLVKEVHYTINGKNNFAIGFSNNSGGMEIRNKYSKICLGIKDVTLIQNPNGAKEIAIFEGFFDYLTYRDMEGQNNLPDILVANSTALLYKIEERITELDKYSKILLFLDNDATGMKVKDIFRQKFQNVEDCSLLYKDFKDLNKWYCKSR